jgi:hypothetical protein
MKRRDKGWGEADSQRAQSTSQPKSPRLELTGRPAGAVHLHVHFQTPRWRIYKPCCFGANLPVTRLIFVSAALIILHPRDSKRPAVPGPL